MKRYCENCLKLEGDKSEIDRFVGKTEMRYLGATFNCFVIDEFLNAPEDLRKPAVNVAEKQQLLEKYGYENLNDWCVANWGTSEIYIELDYDEDEQSFYFITHDSPPDKAIKYISGLYSKIKFTLEYNNSEYEGADMTDYGRIICQDGIIESEKYDKIKR